MLSKGTNINVIQQVLGHSEPSVTKRFYADVKDKERAISIEECRCYRQHQSDTK